MPRRRGAEFPKWLTLVSLLVLLFPATLPAQPVLSASTELSRDGWFRLEWDAAQDQPVVVQEAPSAAFTYPDTLYRGTHAATVITGRPDGRYFFRAALDVPGGSPEWSNPVAVQVEHHSLAKAWMFFSLGALVFLSTVALILWGSRQQAGR